MDLLGLVLALGFVAAPAWFWQGGVLEAEAIDFLGKYWADQPVAQRILDTRGYDEFQSRELSYAMDFLDAQWVGRWLAQGRAWFISPSALAASLLVLAAWAWGAPRAFPRMGRMTSWLLLALYLSNFVFLSTMGVVYRASKPLVAPLLLFLLLFVLREWRFPEVSPHLGFAVVATAGLIMSLFDRQGFLEIVTLAMALLLAWLVRRRGLHLLLGAIAGVGVAQAYNLLLGPWLIHAVNGYWPRMRFQRVRVAQILEPALWTEGLALLRDWTQVLVGSLPEYLLFVGGAATVVVAMRRGPDKQSRFLMSSLALVVIGSQLGMTAVMAQRHEPVTWVDHRLWYYPLPFQTLLLFIIALALEGWARMRGSLPRAVPLVILGLVVSNVAHWPELRERMQSGPWFSAVSRGSAAFKRSLQAGIPDPLLEDGYRRLFFDCLHRFPELASRAKPHVEESDDIEDAFSRDGRLFAWARRESHIVAFAPRGGRYLLEGAFQLRPGDEVEISLTAASPPLLTRVRRAGDLEGPERFTMSVELPRGMTDLTLRSQLPERGVPTSLKPGIAGFGLWLPFWLRPSPEGLSTH